jgi:hypothetical protein
VRRIFGDASLATHYLATHPWRRPGLMPLDLRAGSTRFSKSA